jgi:pimeloyl-ACP methyl ester carboxylesterase
MVTEGEPWANPGRLGQYEACLGWYEDDKKHAAARATIGVPCLVLAFEHDIDSPPARARAAAAEIPGALYVEVEGASHLGPYSHPEAVTDVLTEFFATQ